MTATRLAVAAIVVSVSSILCSVVSIAYSRGFLSGVKACEYVPDATARWYHLEGQP